MGTKSEDGDITPTGSGTRLFFLLLLSTTMDCQ